MAGGGFQAQLGGQPAHQRQAGGKKPAATALPMKYSTASFTAKPKQLVEQEDRELEDRENQIHHNAVMGMLI